MEEISLSVRGQVFKVKKSLLCEYSDYFRAMFSGNYVENKQKEISIDVLEPNTMSIVLQYMKIGLINLFEHNLSTIRDIAEIANFLQMTELIKQTEYSLELEISESNWLEIMQIAEHCSFFKLEHAAAVFGLLAFKRMNTDYIHSLHHLAWYLSNPYLDVENESDAFKFGYEWILKKEYDVDALLLILSCLDVQRLTRYDLDTILGLMEDFKTSLAIKVVHCMLDLYTDHGEISVIENTKENEYIEKYTARVWTETVKIVKASMPRKLVYSVVVPVWLKNNVSNKVSPHCLFTYNNESIKQWIEVGDPVLWGWSIITWGLTKIVTVCGEFERGTGSYMRDVKVYDTMQNHWTAHGVTLPHRRHAGLAIVHNSLYIVGGVGAYRVVLNTAIIYDLKQMTFRPIAKIPEAIQSPAVCAHKNKVYAALQNNIYRYESSGDSDSWVTVVATDIRLSCIRSYKDHIYGIQGYFRHLYRFNPDVDEKMEIVGNFTYLPTTMCVLGSRLLTFTRMLHGESNLYIEEFTDNTNDTCKNRKQFKHTVQSECEKCGVKPSAKKFKGECDKISVIWENDCTQSGGINTVIDVAGSGAVILTMPPLLKDMSEYQQHYLSRYPVNE